MVTSGDVRGTNDDEEEESSSLYYFTRFCDGEPP